MKKLNFQIEVSRVLEILSNDIYDSPYALLRENIQNAYDAILMRIAEEGENSFEPKVEVSITNSTVTISDNGIGMDEDVLQNNFWKAGSSGKNNELAKKAGVVGTFGIGAMANFGVANQIKVTSRKLGTQTTIETLAIREHLSVTEECIDFKLLDDNRIEPGTTVEASIDSIVNVNEAGAIQYLVPYIQYVKIPIVINGKTISQKDYHSLYERSSESVEDSKEIQIDLNNVSCTLRYILNKNGSIRLHILNIIYNQSKLVGDVVLIQGAGSIYGLRNYFGLAPLPAPNNFNLGGVVNLNNLHPTAGREALSRESINIVTHLLNVVEESIGKQICKFDVIDNNPFFLNYIVARSKYELANKIKIEVKPEAEPLTLDNVANEINGRKVYFYGGRDPLTIMSFGNENSYLLHLSQSNPRRQIQTHILRQKGIEEVPDHPKIIKLIDRKDLSYGEVSVMLRISTILSEDYLLADNQIQFAEISHQVPSLIEKEQDTIKVFLSRESSAIQQVITTYSTAYEVFSGFVKDFIRNYLYQKFANYIPSSTRQGAEALHKLLLKNRELFKYEHTDLGDLDSLLNEYVSGEIEFPEVLKRSTTVQRTQTQSVGQGQVGSAEEEIPSLTDNVDQSVINTNTLLPLPPIDRTETKTNKKILKTSKKYPHLNNCCLFLSLSDRVYRRQLDFFFEPHTTKVIWGMHRIVYIFTHASSNLSLYYDIELKERLMNEATGGMAIPTTTILTEDRIFIPIIDELVEYFDIKEGRKEFFVRHDIITDFSTE
ncbi:MAG: ATP-binding protein [Methylococcaceae bacterium]|nr:ATP-binding protein [Methylococcaceae bacterium]